MVMILCKSMKSIKIYGGTPLNGDIKPIANKNTVLPALIASLCSEKSITYHFVPDTLDIQKILSVFETIGVKVEVDDKKITVNASNVDTYKLTHPSMKAFRSGIMFAGPILARFGIVEFYVPGGCKLGLRSINTHLDNFKKLGAKVSYISDDIVRIELDRKDKSKENYIWQSETSVTATENVLMYAAISNTNLTINNAACEPHVKELAMLLESMGVTISGIGTNLISVYGIKSSQLTEVEFKPGPDPVDIAGLITLAAITKGKLNLIDANIPDITEGMLQIFKRFNIKFQLDKNDIIVDGTRDLYIDPLDFGFPMAGEDLPKLTPGPWPNFPVDALPAMVTLACKTKGKLYINNWMYENGLDFSSTLNKMGADIEKVSSHTIIVNGPVEFKSERVTAPSIIQATFAIFAAALADDTEVIIDGYGILNRRYPNIIDSYERLGAKFEHI